MNDIEKMLREGISAESIINEVNKTKERIDREEEQKTLQLEKLTEARSKVNNAVMEYMTTLGLCTSEEDKKEILRSAEIYCKRLEKEILSFNKILNKGIF